MAFYGHITLNIPVLVRSPKNDRWKKWRVNVRDIKEKKKRSR